LKNVHFSFVALAALLMGLSGLAAQSNIRISGEIFDADTGTPLIGANIVVVGTNYGAASDLRGRFVLSDLPPGRYRLQARMLGYRPDEVDVEVKVDVPVELRIGLEPQPIPMPEVVVSAERVSLPHPSAAVTVITRDQIEQRQAKSVAEVLEDVAGVQILATGGLGRSARLSIRGSASNQVLVLLDGQRLNTAQSGSVDLTTIPINWVEKIEVIKGGSAAVYGGEAIGGVVNIITRKAARYGTDRFLVSATVGEFGTRALTPSLRTRLGPVGLQLSYRRLDAEGDFPYRTYLDPPKNSIQVRRVRDNAWTSSNNAFVKLAWKGRPGYTAEIAGQYYDARMGIPGPENQLTLNASQSDRRVLLSAKLGWAIAGGIRAKILAYRHDFLQEYEAPPPGTYLFRNRHRNRATGVDVRLDSRIGSTRVTVGYAFRKDLLKSVDLIRPTRSLGRRQRTTHSAYAQAEIPVVPPGAPAGLTLRLVPAYRVDRPSDNPTAYSPKLGLVLSHGGGWSATLKGNIGKSYRAPTLNSLFWVPDAFALGNPHLRPERATNYDAGAVVRLPLAGMIEAEVTWFGSDVKDIIVWRRQFDGRFRPFNVARAKIRGREDHLSWRLGHGWLVAEVNHTLLDAINRSGERVTDGKQLVFRPRHTTSVSLSTRIGSFSAEVRRRWVSKRYIREANTKFLDPYAITDVRASASLRIAGWNVKLGARINNLTDADYRLIEGYPMPGREWRVTLELGY
jgi:outer membrane cobalamin receptor